MKTLKRTKNPTIRLKLRRSSQNHSFIEPNKCLHYEWHFSISKSPVYFRTISENIYVEQLTINKTTSLNRMKAQQKDPLQVNSSQPYIEFHSNRDYDYA